MRAIASLTSCAVSDATSRVPLTTCDTVAIETPAARATSEMVIIDELRLAGRPLSSPIAPGDWGQPRNTIFIVPRLCHQHSALSRADLPKTAPFAGSPAAVPAGESALVGSNMHTIV